MLIYVIGVPDCVEIMVVLTVDAGSVEIDTTVAVYLRVSVVTVVTGLV